MWTHVSSARGLSATTISLFFLRGIVSCYLRRKTNPLTESNLIQSNHNPSFIFPTLTSYKSSMHKSCLREWLVQQQTCPTCRGDISAGEARQKAQDLLNARIQERQQQEEQGQETNEEETPAGGRTQEDQHSNTAQTSEGETPTDTTDGIKPASKVVNHSDRKLATSTTVSSSQAKHVSIDTPGTTPAHDNFASNERPAFPAFYRVVQDNGASVYHDGDSVSFIVSRVVPCGVVFLGKEMDYRKCNGVNRMMIRMPDGWVSDDDVERIIAVPFESSLQ